MSEREPEPVRRELDAILKRVLEDSERRPPEPELDPVELERQRWMADAERIGVPPRLLRATLEPLKETAALVAVQRWLETHYAAGRCLVLAGPTGVGKSVAGAMALRARPGTGRRYVYFPGACGALLDPNLRAEMRARLIETSFVVLDDFGSEYTKAGGLLDALLDEIIWHREAYILPTIITTNLDAEQLKVRLSERIVDRLRGEWGCVHEVGGVSLRARS
jgi:DNA replication protein DnaC